MDVSKHLNGVKINTGGVNLYINPEADIENGVILFTSENTKYDTNEKRLVIEGPGEYEYQGAYIKGTRKGGVLSYTITYNDRNIYFTLTEGLENIPEDAFLDAVIVGVSEGFDETKIVKIPYPTIYIDNFNVLTKVDAEVVKNVNLKKIVPESTNVFKLS